MRYCALQQFGFASTASAVAATVGQINAGLNRGLQHGLAGAHIKAMAAIFNGHFIHFGRAFIFLKNYFLGLSSLISTNSPSITSSLAARVSGFC